MPAAFSPVDVTVLVVYLVASVGLGLYHARKQRSLEDYFLADRSAPWWAAAISVIASDLSAVSYMGAPAYVFAKDLQLGVGNLLTHLPVMLVIAWLFVPFLARLRLYTIYEYLEGRFGVVARSLASLLFLLLRGGHLMVSIYAQSLALTLITGLATPRAVLLCGTVVTLYTVLGGMKAVIWTDVLQFFVTSAGLLAIVVAVVFDFHGDVRAIWNQCADGGVTRMATFDLDPMIKVTLWALILGDVVMTLATFSCDQVIVQRYLATGSRRAMTRAVVFNGFLTLPVLIGLNGAGLAPAAYYRAHPNLAATLDDPNRVVPHFITNVLPTGVAGLVIAGMLAATMSSVSAGLNSLSTATVVDFWQRFRGQSVTAEQDVRAAKAVTLAWGILVTAPALYIGRFENIVESCLQIIGFFSGPLLGMFLLGMLTERTNTPGVLLGAVAGTAAVGASAAAGVSFFLYGPAGCAATMVVGYALSYCFAAPETAKILPLTIWGQSHEKPKEGSG